jgi:GNAT superfamily N-acetyltransferase
MGLDVLYGAGTAAAFAQRADLSTLLPSCTVQVAESDCEDGSVAVEVIWRDGESERRIGMWRLVFCQGYVECPWVTVEPGYRGQGVLSTLMVACEPWMTSIGLDEMRIMVLPGSEGERALMSMGFGPLPDGGWGTDLQGQRGLEYLAWVKGGEVPADEPAWRTALGPVPPVF